MAKDGISGVFVIPVGNHAIYVQCQIVNKSTHACLRAYLKGKENTGKKKRYVEAYRWSI